MDSDKYLKIQLNSYDFYEIEPSTLIDSYGNDQYMYEQVPIIRIYGSLPTGHNVTMHVHGVFPYMYIQYNEINIKNISNNCTLLHEKLESLLEDYYSNSKKRKKNHNADNIDRNNADYDDDFGGAEEDGNAHTTFTLHKKNKNPVDPKQKYFKYIAKVEVIKGIPFYGYHAGWSLFYKISLLKPRNVNRLSELLRSGNIFETPDNKKIQNKPKLKVFEAHIPYFSQFCLDYNLYGCSWINLKKCYFRSPVWTENIDVQKLWLDDNLNGYLKPYLNTERFLKKEDFPRMSNSLLEIDVLAQFIQNREELEFQDLHSQLKEHGSQDTTTFKDSVSSTKALWSKMEEQRSKLAFGPYKIPDLPNKDTEHPEWSDSKSISEHFERLFLENTNTNYPKSSFINDSLYFSSINTPSKAVTTLWPKDPDELISNKDLKISTNVPKVSKSFKTTSFSSLFDTSFESELIEHVTNRGAKRQNSDLALSFMTDSEFTQKKSKSKRQVTEYTQEVVYLDSTKKESLLGFEEVSIAAQNNFACVFQYKDPPVHFDDMDESLVNLGIPRVNYQPPFFSNPSDFQKDKVYEYAGNRFQIECQSTKNRKPVEFKTTSLKTVEKYLPSLNTYLYIPEPPGYNDIAANEEMYPIDYLNTESQIDITNTNKVTYKYASYDKSTSQSKTKKPQNSLSQLSMEVFVSTRTDMYPDPMEDPINLLFWCYQNENIDLKYSDHGVLCWNTDPSQYQKYFSISKSLNFNIVFFNTEKELIEAAVELVQTLDPDILSGFEIHSSSWGYLIERSTKFYEYDICLDLSRVNFKSLNKVGDRWGYNHASAIKIAGRHMLNIWRMLRKELNLLKYNIENIVFHVLHKRMPHFSHENLSSVWKSGNISLVLNYWNSRLLYNVELLENLEILPKITEQARLVGIDFYSVIYRGSQFKIESILGRITRSEYYIMLSPTKKEVNTQKPIESISLVIEPPSGLYNSPMVVLDFQSLYPSIMIAYNYCYSTILGDVRIMKSKTKNKVGVHDQYLFPENILDSIGRENITIAPNGIMFVKDTVRKSVLSKMLSNILDSRIMIKSLMSLIKKSGKDTFMIRDLHSMQLSLKLILNVTYGYTAASWSGRMPCQEIADSIVETGRETLLKSIKLIESTEKWGAKVVYGDTDSLFVYFPGKTKDEAFKFGREMADVVTKNNPAPVTLKFEKVYLPSLLMAKKRYVGNMYEYENQKIPKLDAKGIEIIRRDGNPAQQKMVEQSIRILFATKDLSKVKKFVQHEFKKIIAGRVLIQDFCFAKEVKLGYYKSEKTMPPGAVLAKKLMEKDHRTEPQYKERIPFVVIKGKKSDLLRDRCITPSEFLSNMDSYLLDSDYYIIKTLIPPLNRIFNLMGIDVFEWWNEIPKGKTHTDGGKESIMKHVRTNKCLKCDKFSLKDVCDSCTEQKEFFESRGLVSSKLSKMDHILKVCRQCISVNYCNANNFQASTLVNSCDSQDCPVYYQRKKTQFILHNSNPHVEVLEIKTQDSHIDQGTDVSIIDLETQNSIMDW